MRTHGGWCVDCSVLCRRHTICERAAACSTACSAQRKKTIHLYLLLLLLLSYFTPSHIRNIGFGTLEYACWRWWRMWRYCRRCSPSPPPYNVRYVGVHHQPQHEYRDSYHHQRQTRRFSICRDEPSDCCAVSARICHLSITAGQQSQNGTQCIIQI